MKPLLITGKGRRENHQSLSLMDLAHFEHFSFCLMVAFQMVIRCRFPSVCVQMCIYACASIPALVCMHVYTCVCEYLCLSVHLCICV